MQTGSGPIINVTAQQTPSKQDFDQLRNLLVGPETNALDAIERRLNELESQIRDVQDRAEFMADALPATLDLSNKADSPLHRALQPKVEQVVHSSVRRDPNVFAEALYPVMGPIIRKIVHKLFESGKHSKWSPYNVEQLFVIHRVSGLVISHKSAPGIVHQDADMVSGMLDAVRSFVQDAFDSHDFDGLRLMTVGDVNVRIEWSPHVVLAAVVRGVEPENLGFALESTLSEIHQVYENQLEVFSGDSSPFEEINSLLNNVLTRTAPSRLSHFWNNYRRKLAIAAAVLALVGIALMIYSASVWNRLLDELAEEPGIVVVNQDHGLWNRELQILKDPFASDVETIVERHGYSTDSISISTSMFYSDDAIIRLQRAAAALSPPDSISLFMDGRTLYVVGKPDKDWLASAISLTNVIEGINKIVRADEAKPEWTAIP